MSTARKRAPTLRARSLQERISLSPIRHDATRPGSTMNTRSNRARAARVAGAAFPSAGPRNRPRVGCRPFPCPATRAFPAAARGLQCLHVLHTKAHRCPEPKAALATPLTQLASRWRWPMGAAAARATWAARSRRSRPFPRPVRPLTGVLVQGGRHEDARRTAGGAAHQHFQSP